VTDEEVLINAGEDEGFGFGPAKYAVGPGLLGYSMYSMRGQTPGGIRRTMADFASNRLEGFYKPGAWKAPRYGLELAKTGGRIGYSAFANLANSGFYNETGISPVVMRDLDGIKTVKDAATKNYMKYKKGYYKQHAIADMKFAEKKLYFKLSNDKANQLIFGGKSSPIIDDIIGDRVKLTNVKDFIKSSSNNAEIANYVMRRQPTINARGQTIWDTKGLQFIKYKPGKFGNVLNSTQFDKRMYNIMLDLKNRGTRNNALNIIPKEFKPRYVGGKFVFSLSPKGKPDWDWGGFNSVAIWDPKDAKTRGKIRFIATDVPDVDIKGRPVPGSGGKFPGIKYVESKEISISERKLKEEIEGKQPKKTGRKNKPGAGRPPLKRDPSDLKFGSLFSAEQRESLKNLKKKRNLFSIANVKNLSRLGRRLPGAAGIALMTYQLLSGDD